MLSRYENVHFTDDIDRKLKSSEALFTSYVESDALMMGNALELILRDEKLKAAMKARDRRTLLTLSQTIFEQLHAKAHVTHFYFSGSDRVNILRVHKPERYGDKIDRFTTLQAEKTGKLFYGIELGPLGTFTLRVVVPWFDDKQLIGYVELGEEIEHITEKLHNILNTELYVLIEKQYLKRTDWETGMKMLGNNAEWDRFPSVVLIARTQKIFPDELSQVFSNTQYIPMMKRMEIILNKSHYSANFARLKDAGNRDVGAMVIMHDVTGILAEYRKDLYFAVVICFGVGAFLILALNIFLGRVELQRKQAEEELREKEKRYRLLFNNVSDAVFVHEVSQDVYMPGRFIEVNEVACRYLGYSREELLQMSVPQIDAPETLENVPNILKKLFAEGHAMWEGIHMSKDGRRIPVEISNQLFNLHDKPMILSTVRDITVRKAVENKIKLTLSILQATLESTSEGIMVVDNSGKVTVHNKKFQDMWRIPDNLLAEGSDKSLLDYVLGQLKEPDAFIKKVNELYASPDNESYDILEFKDGRIFRRYSQAQRIDGEAVGRVWSFRDVTDRERAEKRIKEYQKKTEALINASSDYIVLKDVNLRNIILNKACGNLFQLDINDLIGKTDLEFMPEDIALNCRKSDEMALRSEGVIVTEEFSMGKWFHAVKQKVIDENGDILGVAAVIRDITDRKEYEIRLAKSLKEKEMLLKELHHRVKNNLQILSSLISFQIKDDNGARVNQILTECKDRVKTIAIIHDKLYQSEDMTSIEVRKLISDIANSLIYSFRDTGSQIDLILNIQDISIGIDIAIPIGLIINEIVSNSVKYAFPSKMNGEVCIDFHAMNGEFVLNVHDNGIGLPEDFNTEKSDSLGMYLIYTLAEQLNGRAEFIRNNGTTVKIHFKK